MPQVAPEGMRWPSSATDCALGRPIGGPRLRGVGLAMRACGELPGAASFPAGSLAALLWRNLEARVAYRQM